MADLKISALTASTTPLAGTEVLPIVQSGSTVKVSVADLTAGRSVSMSTMTATDGTRQTYTSVSASNNVIRQTNGLTYEWAYGLSAPGVSGLADSYSITRFNGTGWTLLAQMDSSGNQTLSTGNLVIGTSGKGIDFSATSGSGTSELLADYEEGDWTPTVVGDSTPGTATYSVQIGRYTKIGSRVFFACRLVWTGGTGTGAMRVSGLPYTSASITNFLDACSIIPNDITLTALNYAIAYVFNGSAFISIDQTPVGGGAGTNVTYDAAGSLNISGSYLV